MLEYCKKRHDQDMDASRVAFEAGNYGKARALHIAALAWVQAGLAICEADATAPRVGSVDYCRTYLN